MYSGTTNNIIGLNQGKVLRQFNEAHEKYIDFNNKRIKELETHFTHLKIEMNENELSDEKMNAQDKRNASE